MRPLLFLFALISGGSAFAELGPVVGAKPGYLSSVREERHWREVEMVLLPARGWNARDSALMGRSIFDTKLTKEFETQYELKFGRTEAERNLDNSSRYSMLETPGGEYESIDAYSDRQRKFGEYMVRRLTEHHVDQWAKSNPDVRPVYELKDRIQNVSVQMKKGYKLRLHYSLSGNYVDAKVENPYNIGSKVTFQMRDGGFGPSRVERTILGLEYPWSKTIKLSAFHELDTKASTSLVGAKRLNRTLSCTLTLSQNAPVDRDVWQTSPRHDLALVGLAWTE
jgi:hypothetical protein